MPEEKPNILFLLSDQHSFRFIDDGQNVRKESITTPALRSLYDNGVAFNETYCQSPLCTPSRLSMFSGRLAHRCNAWANGNILPPRCDTIPSTLKKAGYRTCHVGKLHFGGNRQFVGFQDRPYGDLTGEMGHQWEPLTIGGFERERALEMGISQIPESHIQENVVTRESLSWIREREAAGETPWFLCACFTRPHFPLTTPRRFIERFWDLEKDEPKKRLSVPFIGEESETSNHPMIKRYSEYFELDGISPFDSQRARAGYFACVEFLDEIIDDFLSILKMNGLLKNTIIIYTSDHGELAGEHGLWWKRTWHEASTRVPLVITTPEQKERSTGKSINKPVGLVDLFPTICGLVGVDPPTGLDGEDLSPSVTKGIEPKRDPVVCDHFFPRWSEDDGFRMIRDDEIKYVQFRNSPPIIFNLHNDPLEQKNLQMNMNKNGTNGIELPDNFGEYTVDFDKIDKYYNKNKGLDKEYPLEQQSNSASGNCYFMNNGKIIDADTSLYSPDVVVGNPQEIYDDYEK